MSRISNLNPSAMFSVSACCLLLGNVPGCSKRTSQPNSDISTRPASAAAENRSCETRDDPTITVEIDGKAATPAEKEAFGALAKQLFSDAIGKAMQKSLVEMCRKLGIEDDVEGGLLSALPKVGEAGPADALNSIYLIRPGKGSEPPQTIVLVVKDKPFIRLTRANAPVERPVAIVTVTTVKDGQPSISEWFLVHEADGKWKKQRASSRTEVMSK